MGRKIKLFDDADGNGLDPLWRPVKRVATPPRSMIEQGQEPIRTRPRQRHSNHRDKYHPQSDRPYPVPIPAVPLKGLTADLAEFGLSAGRQPKATTEITFCEPALLDVGCSLSRGPASRCPPLNLTTLGCQTGLVGPNISGSSAVPDCTT